MPRRKPKVGGRRKGAGRPPSIDPRRNKVTIKLTDHLHTAVKAAAKAADRSVSDWGSAALERALDVGTSDTGDPGG